MAALSLFIFLRLIPLSPPAVGLLNTRDKHTDVHDCAQISQMMTMHLTLSDSTNTLRQGDWTTSSPAEMEEDKEDEEGQEEMDGDRQ